MELICPAGTPAAFTAAVDAGADAVYCGFRDETNARNFPGLNFSPAELGEAIAYAHRAGARVFVTLNTFMRAGAEAVWYEAADRAAALGADALIVADIGLMAYLAERHPDLRLHVSVQAAAANPDAIRFFVDSFGARRVVLPRVLTIPEIAAISRTAGCETEVFVFGGLCVMAEGRCALSSYATGLSPNMNGVCSPASHVGYRRDGDAMVSTLGGFTINRFADGEPAGYPTLCKGRFATSCGTGYAFEDPASLDVLSQLEDLRAAGVSALKIEGRQRGRAYVFEVVRTIRALLDQPPERRGAAVARLHALAEGQKTTAGAYDKRWR